MAEIFVTSKQLIETLHITGQELIDLEQFIDADPEDEWDLKLSTDYRVVASSGLREYTFAGAFAVAECLEFRKQQNNNWFQKLIEKLIKAIKGDIRKTFVKQQILNNSSSLVQNNNVFFLSKMDVVSIFRTKPSYLKKISEIARQDDLTTLIQGSDYLDLPDQGIYYSLSGMMKLGKVFAKEIKRRNRKDWCGDVGLEIAPCMDDILKQIKKRSDGIESAKKQAKKKAGSFCQVTNVKGNPVEKISMAGHHLYSSAEYPHLVDSVDNIICITCEVHEHFHQWMGGTQKSCTLDDFEKFVQQFHPASSVFIWLHQQRLKLGNQQPITLKERHVLHLSWPIKLLNAVK
jgi:hypothetical protein